MEQIHVLGISNSDMNGGMLTFIIFSQKFSTMPPPQSTLIGASLPNYNNRDNDDMYEKNTMQIFYVQLIIYDQLLYSMGNLAYYSVSYCIFSAHLSLW